MRELFLGVAIGAAAMGLAFSIKLHGRRWWRKLLGRCQAVESGGVQCERHAHHWGRHRCPRALKKYFG